MPVDFSNAFGAISAMVDLPKIRRRLSLYQAEFKAVIAVYGDDLDAYKLRAQLGLLHQMVRVSLSPVGLFCECCRMSLL